MNGTIKKLRSTTARTKKKETHTEKRTRMNEMASAYKVAYHRQKLEAYLRNEPILPATVELDISSKCSRRCPSCPSTTSKYSSTLDLDFIKRLFVRLEGETKGLLLSGGEPTLSPIFPEVLRLAREHGFVDIAIVTNGDLLGREEVASALCAYASTIRISIYDWTKEPREETEATLQQIRKLRSRIDQEGSKLEIGVSALTSAENADAVSAAVRDVASAGAHWIYFHPMCIRWEVGAPERVDQERVLTKIRECQEEQSGKFQVFTFPDRYVEHRIDFSGYHAAHFLLVIGADGINYLGAETKYHPQYAIADLAKNWSEDFLWQRERLKLIESVNSRTYAPMSSRHRGILYNNIIQGLINSGTKSLDGTAAIRQESYAFPHIL